MTDKQLKRVEKKIDAILKTSQAIDERLKRIETTMGMEAEEFVEKNRPAKRLRDEAEEVSGTESEIERREAPSESEDDLVVIPIRIEQSKNTVIVVFLTEDDETKSMEAKTFAKKHSQEMDKFKRLPGMSLLREYLETDEFDFQITIPEAAGPLCRYHGFSHAADRFEPGAESCRVWLGKRT